MKAVALHSAADAAGEAAHHILILMLDAATHRHHVTRASIFGIDRTEHVIKKRALFELGILHFRANGKKTTRHLEDVVDIATLIGAPIYAIAKLIGWAKVFIP